MEILNTRNMQLKTVQDNSVGKPTNNLTKSPTNSSSVYGGSIKTVKQRAHKFNAIAIGNINSTSSSSNIPMPNKSILNGSSSKVQHQQHSKSSKAENENRNNVVSSKNGIKNSSSNSSATKREVSTTKVDSNNNNHNIKINIVNKYVSSKNTTLVDNKKINSELENLATVTGILKKAPVMMTAPLTPPTTTTPDDEIKSDPNHNTANGNISAAANRALLKTGDVIKNKINQLNQANVASVSPSKASTTSLAATPWNLSGWIRIFCGPDRSEFSCEDPNRMVLVYSTSTTNEIVKEMALPGEYTLWVQIGGEKPRRLSDEEQPLMIQEDFLRKIGYVDDSRRSRLCIDPDLKYLIRFHIGPTGNPLCRGATKCGNVELLKGFIFPQWTRRTIAIIGTKLIVYSSNPGLMPEVFDLSSSEIFEHSPVYNRLIIKIVPKINESTEIDCLSLLKKSNECLSSNNNGNSKSSNSNLSDCSNGNNDRNVVLFLGFEDSWERDLWSNWLMEATTELSEPRRMDISGSGLHIIPEVILQSSNLVEELFADHNKLQESAMKALTDLKKLRVLKVTANHLKKFPEQIMDIMNLTVLDISKNEIDKLPDNIFKMEKLEELRIDDNLLGALPNTLKLLRNLKSISVSNNRIVTLPDFMIAMRFNNSIDYSKQNQLDGKVGETPRIDYSNPPLKKLNLRSNSLRGSIIIGNFTYLTQIDMSENSIEYLDLSALDKIESVQCCKNQIKELTLNGRVLNSLVASHNKLFRLIVKPLPKSIRHIDVSYNQLTEVPEWLNDCHQLRTLYANNNNICILPENLFQNEIGMLHTIQLACNRLTKLPAMPKKLLPLQELYVNGNQIEDLPEHFFAACENLILLNVSNNRLVMLPILDGNRSHLERLYASNNMLHDRVLDTIMNLTSLRILHLSYNRLTAFPECCISNWPDIEELNISGNKIQHLPENLSNSRSLRVLRAHSNQLQSTPIFSRVQSLRVLDLAHNQLDKINLTVLVPKKLQFLDLSCNLQLQVDAKQLQNCRSQRPISLVDVSGKNRPSLPTTPPSSNSFDNVDVELPWKVGFSETTGNANKLYISQLRLPGFCNVEGLFGMFDGESNNTLPNILVKAIPKILLEERTVKETSNDYMKYTLLSAHRELKQQGQKSGVTATLCHISRTKVSTESSYNAYQTNSTRKFVLKVATVGDCQAILIRDKGYLKLSSESLKTKIGCSAGYPMILPDPECNDVILSDQDEYLVIANKKLWDVMTPENVVCEVKKQDNVLLSAKRLQDIAQSYGAEENISVIVVRFNNLGTDIDFLMRELRHTIKKKPNGSVISGFCKCGCCCETNSNCCHSNNNNTNGQFNRQPSSRSDRSSPSGQSDQSISDNQSQATKDKTANIKTLAKPMSDDDKKNLKTGIARAVRARIEEEREKNNESDSMMSEEQFKCWEYMLEQNTQLLFDKELNTISKAFTKRNQSNLNRKHVRSLSTSTPIIASQLEVPKGNFAHFAPLINSSTSNSSTTLNLRQAEFPSNVFLSKHFGSARSFHQANQSLFKPIRMNPAGASPRLSLPMAGGPNAAYFGSLQRLNMGTPVEPQHFAQRLMPYNLEYDFGMIKERPLAEEVEAVNETDNSRMQHYWGVATTEL